MENVSKVTATAILANDHRTIEKVIPAMSMVADNAEQGRLLDISILRDLILFLRIFAEECQTAKEERGLFPALEAKNVLPAGCTVAVLKDEHQRAASLTKELLAALDAYTSGGYASSQGILISTLRSLAALYREHIWKEDHILLPIAEKVLSRKEQDVLCETFQRTESSINADELAARIEQHARRCVCHMGQVLI